MRRANSITLEERELISRGLAKGDSLRSIAIELGGAPSTVSRELVRNGGVDRYRACVAEKTFLNRSKRPKPLLLRENRHQLCKPIPSPNFQRRAKMKKPASLLLIVSSVLILTACSPSLDKQIIGKWKYSFAIDLDDKDAVVPLKMNLSCVEDIFPNKSSAQDCTFDIAGDTRARDGSPLKIAIGGTIKVTQEWSIVDKIIYNKTVDTAFSFDLVSFNGIEMTDSDALADMKKEMDQDNPFMKGETDKVKTISIDKDKWVFEIEMDKKPITIMATRS